MNQWRRSVGSLISFGDIGSIEKLLRTRGLKHQFPSSSNLYFLAFLPFVLSVGAFLVMAGCAAYATKTDPLQQTPLISIAMTQTPPPSLTVGASAQVNATVTNDLADAGVDWVATCSSAPHCGSFSPPHTASGIATNYSAPLSVPAHGTVSVTALSATDRSKTFSATVTIVSTITGVTITQPPPPSAPAGATITLAATVTGDPSNEGIDWKAKCGVVDCTPIGWHSAPGAPSTFLIPGPLQIPTIVGSTVTITAFATADHNFSASATFTVTDPISINLTQTPPSKMFTNATATVVAVVSNDTTNSGVTWSVSCSSAPCGTVSPTQTASGAPATFTAPPSVPAPNPTPNPVVVITATSTSAGSSVSATASVTIVAPISISITQGVPTRSIVQNASAPLVATVSNDPASAGVDWTVTCGSPGACGTFSPTHTDSGAAATFTAPSAVPVGSSVTITATSTSDSTRTATETDTVTSGVPPNSLLLGQFVMLLSGKNSSNGPYFIGGVMTGDGLGGITSGAFDLADASGNASSSVPAISTSTYSIGPDGRGQIHLLVNTGALSGSFGVNGSGEIILSVVFVSPQHALLSEVDSFGNGTGTLDLQNPADLASFQQGAWHNGTYSLKLSGAEAAQPYRDYFVASAVNIDFSTSAYSYVADQSDHGAITSVPFTTVPHNLGFTRSQNGKVTFVSVDLGLPTRFALDAWLIDSTHFAVTDWSDSAFGTPPVIVAGYLTAQPSSPSVSGTYTFTEVGATTVAKPQAAGGILTCGSTGTLDVVPTGGTALTNEPINATCAAPVNGRGLISVSGATTGGISQFAAYPTEDQGLYLVELDGGPTGASGPSGAGVALQQTVSAPISASVFGGKYASNFQASTTLGSENFAAQVVSDGVSAVSGVADVNSFNATTPPLAGTPSSKAALSSSFTTSPGGRFPLTLSFTPATGQPTPEITTLNTVCYIVDANTCMILGVDTTAPGAGILRLQNTGL